MDKQAGASFRGCTWMNLVLILFCSLKKQFGMGELPSFAGGQLYWGGVPKPVPRTQMTPVLIGVSALFLGGWPSKIEVIGALGMVSKLNIIIPTS